MSLNFPAILRSFAFVGLGVLAGAGGGVAVWQKLHPPLKLRPDLGGAPGGSSLAPPEDPPEDVAVPPVKPPVEVVKPPPDPVAPRPDVVVKPPVPDPVAKPPDFGPEYFGFPVGSRARAPEPKPEPKPEPPPEPKPVAKPEPPPPAKPAIVSLVFMKDRCVAGFDGKSTLHDFSGWTKSVTGTIEYEEGHLATTARASATVDARTLDTGDADRDKEMHEVSLESAKFPEMKFEVASVTLGEGEAMTMRGSIEIHGVKKTVEIPCTFRKRRDLKVYVKGEVALKMTDFGIKPPSKAGFINVDDDIRVWFEAWAEPVKGAKK